jgi:hypothetical protein
MEMGALESDHRIRRATPQLRLALLDSRLIFPGKIQSVRG